MLKNIKSSPSYLDGQQDWTNPDSPSIQTRPAPLMHANDGSSRMHARAGMHDIQPRKKAPGTLSVLQQKFPASQEFSFIRSKNGKVFFEGLNGHFYPMPSGNFEESQKKFTTSLSFTPEGLNNLRRKYDEIHGSTTFLHAYLKMEKYSPDLHDMMKNPALHCYFKEEKFLILANMSYDPASDRYASPKSQKLKDQGVSLLAWFIYPNLNSINDDTRTLLRELSEGGASLKPFIEQLRKRCESATPDRSKQIAKDEKTIGQLKQNSEYLASILDLEASHVPMLKSLKEKTMRHLAETYGVGVNDQVALSFHFPYSENHLTLHLHIRVNHGLHPFEQGESFTLDHIISGLSAGKTIDEIILEKQCKNNGLIYRSISPLDATCDNIEGVVVNRCSENIYRLDSEKSNAKTAHSRDDLFYLRD